MNNTQDISTYTMTELKALAFDLLATRGNIDANLKVVNDRMNELLNMQSPGEVIAETEPVERSTVEPIEPTEPVDKSE